MKPKITSQILSASASKNKCLQISMHIITCKSPQQSINLLKNLRIKWQLRQRIRTRAISAWINGKIMGIFRTLKGFLSGCVYIYIYIIWICLLCVLVCCCCCCCCCFATMMPVLYFLQSHDHECHVVMLKNHGGSDYSIPTQKSDWDS